MHGLGEADGGHTHIYLEEVQFLDFIPGATAVIVYTLFEPWYSGWLAAQDLE